MLEVCLIDLAAEDESDWSELRREGILSLNLHSFHRGYPVVFISL